MGDLKRLTLAFFSLVFVLVSCGKGSDSMVTTSSTNTVVTEHTVSDASGANTNTNANLSYLSVSQGALSPHFSPSTTSYTALFIGASTVTVTPVAAVYGAAVQVNDQVVPSETASPAIPLNNGENTITVKVIAPDGATSKTYTITAIRISQEAYLKSSNTGTNDKSGNRVSVSGDTLAVGAYGEASNALGVNGNQTDNSASSSGAVYVFTRTGSTWTQQAYLKSSNTGTADWFGSSVSLSGDTLAVGAVYEASNAKGVNGNQADNSASMSGAVYVFTRTGSTWTQQAYIKGSNTKTLDFFGWSISVSGDTLAVGAIGEDSNAKGVNGDQADTSASMSGAVYVFTRTGSTWDQQGYIKASNTETDDRFGSSVAVSGDTLAVGAYAEASNAKGVNGDQSDNSAPDSGAVYVFTRTGSAWNQQAYIKASNAETNDSFGSSVSVSGDTLAVGASAEASNATGVNGNQADNSASDSGAVYVFARTGSIWSQQAYIKASNTEGMDTFGSSVSVSGDSLAVGASVEASNATGVNGDQADNSVLNSGAVYVFARIGTTWSQQAYIKASNTGQTDAFGSSVSLSDGTLAVGASGEDSDTTGVNGNQTNNNASNSGAVYVFQ